MMRREKSKEYPVLGDGLLDEPSEAADPAEAVTAEPADTQEEKAEFDFSKDGMSTIDPRLVQCVVIVRKTGEGPLEIYPNDFDPLKHRRVMPDGTVCD